ncbi:hypothetical protein [Streptomyces sp. ST2-7A]|uniref:hypothetical protein n=1 Tax=Streptomyces sp. ST2-7A TaxID=2907214 RepID=UPI001F298AF3|nr:hypothetical protein [Streptomyces sp. ST2-7A]MCE7079625.1 hypothetical protein [Streptomyces sp. ST2-7A]
MRIRSVDPRDTTLEHDEARYRVYPWDADNNVSDEYEISGVDVDVVLECARQRASTRGGGYAVYVRVDREDGVELIRIAGAAGDPFGDRPGTG